VIAILGLSSPFLHVLLKEGRRERERERERESDKIREMKELERTIERMTEVKGRKY